MELEDDELVVLADFDDSLELEFEVEPESELDDDSLFAASVPLRESVR